MNPKIIRMESGRGIQIMTLPVGYSGLSKSIFSDLGKKAMYFSSTLATGVHTGKLVHEEVSRCFPVLTSRRKNGSARAAGSALASSQGAGHRMFSRRCRSLNRG